MNALVKWTPPARPSGPPTGASAYRSATVIRAGGTFPVVAGLLFVGVAAAMHLLALALVVAVALVAAAGSALWWIACRARRPLAELELGVPAEDEDPEPDVPATPTSPATRVTVEVVDEGPRLALPAAPQADPLPVEAAPVPACHGSADGPCQGYWTWTSSCHQPSGRMGHDWCGGWVNPLALGGKTPSPCACPCHERGNDPWSLEDARRRTGAALDGLLGYYVGALEHSGLADTPVGARGGAR